MLTQADSITQDYDCFINSAEIQCKKLNIFNLPDPGSPQPINLSVKLLPL